MYVFTPNTFHPLGGVRWQFLHHFPAGWRLQPGGGASLAVAWLVATGRGVGHRMKSGGDCTGKNCIYIYPQKMPLSSLDRNWPTTGTKNRENPPKMTYSGQIIPQMVVIVREFPENFTNI